MLSLKKSLHSFRYAWAGIVYFIRTENNTKVHLVISVLVFFLSFYFRLSTLEWIAVVLCLGIVWAAELINTAIEQAVNLASPEKNETAKYAKDLAAAAVLITALMSVCIGCIIFIPKILGLFFI